MKNLKSILVLFLAVALLISFVVMATGQDKKENKKEVTSTEKTVSSDQAKCPHAVAAHSEKLEPGTCPHSKSAKVMLKDAISKSDCANKCKTECEKSAKCETECKEACEKAAATTDKDKK